MKSTKSPSWSERLLGLSPIAAPPHAFRVDAESIAYAGFRREGEVYSVAETAELPLPAETFHDGLLGGPPREPERFREAVGALVARIAEPPREASLVLPDSWLRVAFTELATAPTSAERDDVLRWKLKRLVPFRVDELRLSGQTVARLPQQSDEEPHRVLLGFAAEALLAQIEESFAAAGVRLGRITSTSLALVAALAGRVDAGAITAVAIVDQGGYSLLFTRDGEPVLHRYKSFAGGLPEGSLDGFVGRDLRLTRNFLAEQVPDVPVTRAVVAAPAAVRSPWVERLSQALDAPTEPIGREHLPPLDASVPRTDWHRLAPLLGAVAAEVA